MSFLSCTPTVFVIGNEYEILVNTEKNGIICVAVGDEGNDIAMFKVAGLGACMANARDEVKPFADYVTKNTNDQSGVAEVIHKFLIGVK